MFHMVLCVKLFTSEYVSLVLFFDDVFSKDVDYEELARCTDDFNGAQCKAVCVEAVSCWSLTDSFEAVYFCYLFIMRCDVS